MGRELPGVFCVFNNHNSNGLIWQHIVLYLWMEIEVYAGIFFELLIVVLLRL